jgi:hypothetical protein
MTINLTRDDESNIRYIQKKSASRHKAPAIRGALRKYAQLLKLQREAEGAGAQLRLVLVTGGKKPPTVLLDRVDLEV